MLFLSAGMCGPMYGVDVRSSPAVSAATRASDGARTGAAAATSPYATAATTDGAAVWRVGGTGAVRPDDADAGRSSCSLWSGVEASNQLPLPPPDSVTRAA